MTKVIIVFRMLTTVRAHWSNPSVSFFAGDRDPMEKMMQVALSVALEAIQEGWQGPPFDPFCLAEHLRIKTVPREDVEDARTVPIGSDRIQIEYNPSRPKQRIRFSIAHEIAHTFFPDCSERVRYRASAQARPPGEWELEMLCNIGAAELLMPTGSLPDFKKKALAIEGLLELRKQYEVSAESLALRYMNNTEQPAAVFVASRKAESSPKRYHIDYAFSSRSWPLRLNKGFALPEDSVVERCTAIGYIAKARECWAPNLGQANIECVGLPPYSNSLYPRVLGLIYPEVDPAKPATEIRFVIGDATQPSGTGIQLLAHVVNDKTPNWGAGFGLAVRQAWPPIQDEFRSWTLKDPSRFRLGNIFLTEISDGLFIAPMICQHGYGPSEKPRIRYAALKECLQKVMTKAVELGASVHMPRIGSGYGGGSWALIEQLIDESLCRYSVPVTVYDLPSAEMPVMQRGLFD